jgi:hypothetical protein
MSQRPDDPRGYASAGFSNDQMDAVVKLHCLHMHPMRYSRRWGMGGVRRLARDDGDLQPRLMKMERADAAGSASPQEKLNDLEAQLAEAKGRAGQQVRPAGHRPRHHADLPVARLAPRSPRPCGG